MNAINTIEQSVNNVLCMVNKTDEATFSPCTLTINTETLEYTALLTKIDNFKAEQGWIAYQSENIAFKTKEDCTKQLKTGGVSSNKPDKGKLLSAELSNQTQSMSIRHLYAQQWQVTTFTPDKRGKEYLCDTITHYATSGLGALNYQRLWQQTEQGYEPCASYFTSFEGEK